MLTGERPNLPQPSSAASPTQQHLLQQPITRQGLIPYQGPHFHHGQGTGGTRGSFYGCQAGKGKADLSHWSKPPYARPRYVVSQCSGVDPGLSASQGGPVSMGQSTCAESVESLGTVFSARGNAFSKSGWSRNGNCKFRALDLFSGTGSVGSRLREWGFQVTSLDNNPNCKADMCLDIMTWDYKRQHSPGYFQVIAASVPCEEYSSAKTTQVRDLGKADLIVRKVLEIVAYFQPGLWWIENPRKGWLRHRGFMQGLPFVDLDYCQFSEWGYQKPTRFWGSSQLGHLPNVLCDFQNCINIVEDDNGNWHHRERLGGYQQIYSTKDKGRIPATVVDYLLGSTFQRDRGFLRRHSKWQKSGVVRVQQIEKNEDSGSDQGLSDGDDSVHSEDFLSIQKKEVSPERVWVLPSRLCKSRSRYGINSLKERKKKSC